MTRIKRSIEIEAEPERVFKVLNDIENRPKWDNFVEESNILSAQKTGPGTQIRYVFKRKNKTFEHNETITEYEENKKIGSRSDKGKVIGEELIELEKTPTGTKVDVSIDYEAKSSWGKVVDRLVYSKKADEAMMKSLKNLKYYIEKS